MTMMRKTLSQRVRPWLLIALSFNLAACAQPAIPPAPLETSPLTGKITTGTVAAVRPVDINPSSGALITINTVLTALGEAPITGPVHGREVVVERGNRTAISIATPHTNLNTGDQVSVVEAATTSVHHD
jgi:hypothetical protein